MLNKNKYFQTAFNIEIHLLHKIIIKLICYLNYLVHQYTQSTFYLSPPKIHYFSLTIH